MGNTRQRCGVFEEHGGARGPWEQKGEEGWVEPHRSYSNLNEGVPTSVKTPGLTGNERLLGLFGEELWGRSKGVGHGRQNNLKLPGIEGFVKP